MTTINNITRTNAALTSWEEDGEEFTVTLNASGKPASIQSKRGRWIQQECTVKYDSAGNFIGLSGDIKTLMLPDLIADANGTVRTVTGGFGVATMVAPGAALVMTSVLHQSAIPVGIPSGGTMADNGRVTLTTALPLAYTTGIYLYFPSAAVYSASTAGFYYVVMDNASQTVGTVYNNIYVPGVTPLAIPATPSPIAATGPGAFTGSTLALTVAAATVPGSSLGKNGRLDFQYYGSNNNTAAQNKIITLNLGGQQLHSLNNNTTVCFSIARFVVANRGREDRQVSSNAATNGQSSAAPLQFSVDTTADQLVEIKLQHSSSATDVIMLECASIVAEVG